MGSDRSNDKAATVGGEDRATAAERIGSGAGGSGNNKPVARIGSHKVGIDIEVGAEDSVVVEAVKAHLVEGGRHQLIIGVAGNNMKKGAGFEGIAMGGEVGHKRVEVVATRGGEETQMAEIDAENRDVAVAEQMNRTEEGAVATDREKEIVVALGKGVGHLVVFNLIFLKYFHQLVEVMAGTFFKITGI